MKNGVVSISFRKLNVDSIIEMVKKSGLDGIEWGGDIHVPHGDLKTAEIVKSKMLKANLEVAAYGSYYKVGISENNGLLFNDVLASAKTLGAPVIRVWAGNLSPQDADNDYCKKVTNDAIRIADLSESYNIKIAFEYHSKTLTETNDSALKFMNSLNHKNIEFYWQPSSDKSIEYNKAGIENILPRLNNIHVFHWLKNNRRDELSNGISEWSSYFKTINKSKSQRFALLEFIKDNSIEQFYKDAEILKELTNS